MISHNIIVDSLVTIKTKLSFNTSNVIQRGRRGFHGYLVDYCVHLLYCNCRCSFKQNKVFKIFNFCLAKYVGLSCRKCHIWVVSLRASLKNFWNKFMVQMTSVNSKTVNEGQIEILKSMVLKWHSKPITNLTGGL